MIGKLWRWLFGGCEHKWAHLTSGVIAMSCDKRVIGRHYEQRCEKCQRIRYFNTWIGG